MLFANKVKAFDILLALADKEKEMSIEWQSW